jgi:hypothetical protein
MTMFCDEEETNTFQVPNFTSLKMPRTLSLDEIIDLPTIDDRIQARAIVIQLPENATHRPQPL